MAGVDIKFILSMVTLVTNFDYFEPKNNHSNDKCD